MDQKMLEDSVKMVFKLTEENYDLRKRIDILEDLTYDYATGKTDGEEIKTYVQNALKL